MPNDKPDLESAMMRERINSIAHDMSEAASVVIHQCARIRVLCPPMTKDEEAEIRDLEAACDRVMKRCHDMRKI